MDTIIEESFACGRGSLSRRGFVKAGAAFAAVPAVLRAAPAAAANLRLGVISDTHIRLRPAANIWEAKFERVLRRFDAEKVDAVLIAGDLIDFGLVSELRIFAEVWYKVFPGDRRSDGGHVEKLFIYGDHDTGGYIQDRINPSMRVYPQGKEAIHKDTIAFVDRAAVWKELFREDWAPVMKKTVKGYDFILVHHAQGEPENKYGANAPAMKPFYEKYRPDPSRPFFHVQHRVCKDTVYCPGICNTDDGKSTEILSRFPNCFAFTGHGHKFFNNDRSLWQGAFTVLQVPSLAYVSPIWGRENSTLTPEQSKAKYVPQMKASSGLGLSTEQGFIADIHDDRIILRRVDFQSPPPGALMPDWVVPLPLGRKKPFSFAAMEATLPVPRFPRGAAVKVASVNGKNRKGEEVEQVKVTFPTVLTTSAGPRAFDYEVTAEGADGKRLVKRVYSPRFWRAECAEPAESECVFSKTELPAGPVRFSVRPANSFGKAGPAIRSERKNTNA